MGSPVPMVPARWVATMGAEDAAAADFPAGRIMRKSWCVWCPINALPMEKRARNNPLDEVAHLPHLI